MKRRSQRKYRQELRSTRPEVIAFGGGLEGAERTSRETLLWNPSRRSPDQIINGVKDEADARGRDVVTNDGYAQGTVDTHRDSIVGTQYRLNSQPNWTVLQQLYGKAFDETWAEEFQLAYEEKFNLIADSDDCWLDAARRQTFTGHVRLAVAGFVYTGEVLATAEWIRENSRPFSTAIQMISPSRLSNPDGKMDDERLRRGVLRDDRGRPFGYYIRASHPTEFYQFDSFRWKYVPASKPWNRKMVIHIADAIQPDQTRGLSPLVAVLKEMRMTKRFQEVVLQNAVINASYAATIESELPSDVIAAAMGQGQTPTAGYMGIMNTYLTALQSYLKDANGIAVDGAKMPHLFPGTKLNAKTLGTPGGVGTEFEVSLLRHVAAGLGIGYEEFAKDYSKTNYSSARASMLGTWKNMQGKKKFIADRFANQVSTLWLEEDMNAGNMPLPRGWDSRIWYQPFGKDCLTACDWIGAGRGQIDELKETQAALLRIKGGLSTHEFEIARQGNDYRKVFRQRSREQKLAESLGLNFDEKPGSAERDGSTSGQTVMEMLGTIVGDRSAATTEAIVEAIKAQPQPILNVTIPRAGVERTRVTKHDENGRILEFEKEEVD